MKGDVEGEVVRAWRERRGMTRRELALKAGMHFTSLGAYETGKRRIGESNFARICAALELEPFGLCLDIARAKADRLDAEVDKVRLESGQGPLKGRRMAELEWASGIVLDALKDIAIYFAAQSK